MNASTKFEIDSLSVRKSTVIAQLIRGQEMAGIQLNKS